MLTLDNTTLFYWTLSADNEAKRRKHAPRDDVERWAGAVSAKVRPSSRVTSRAGSIKTTHSSRYGPPGPPPSLFSGSTASSAPSVLTNAIKIASGSNRHFNVKAEKPVVKVEESEIVVIDGGGVSDNDEMEGPEREVALASPPPKKGERANSAVSLFQTIMMD